MLDTNAQSSSDHPSRRTTPTGDCRQASALTVEALEKLLGHLMHGVLWPRARAGTSSPHSPCHETDTQTCSSSCASADTAGFMVSTAIVSSDRGLSAMSAADLQQLLRERGHGGPPALAPQQPRSLLDAGLYVGLRQAVQQALHALYEPF